MKLLIVDDEIFAIQGILKGVKWDTLDYEEVLQANNYTQAIRQMEKKRPEVALCDIEMPCESGLELIAWINENYPETECIILSCHDNFDFARQAVQLKCMDYILKPARYDFLTDVLRRAGELIIKKNRQAMLEGYGKAYIDQLSDTCMEEKVDVVEQVMDYINQHLAEDLSVKTLANMVYISPDHLTRSFKKRYHQTISEYILQKRMLTAAEMLHNEKVTVSMVANRVGYGNYSYFTEQFKKFYRKTPREYQLQQKDKDTDNEKENL